MWQLWSSSIARILVPMASCNMAFFRVFNPILARLQKTLSEHLLGDREGTRTLYLQRKFQQQRTSKASTVRARNFSKCNRMCFWNSPHFWSSKLWKNHERRGILHSLKFSEAGLEVCKPPVAVLQFFKNHENSKFQ